MRTRIMNQLQSEPWSSMQRLTKTNKTTLQSEWISALKKDLTGPTLLEISGYPKELAPPHQSNNVSLHAKLSEPRLV